MAMSEKLLADLRGTARSALDRCYVPYSGFMVIAAVKTPQGTFGGANVEVANYSLTKHAEEAAIMNAIAAGAPLDARGWLQSLYVCGGAPCGSCRQFIWEFATANSEIVVDRPYGTVAWSGPITELLPLSFGPDDLRRYRRKPRPPDGL
jgi:cytidine deaminase